MYGKLGHGNESGHATPKRVEGLVGLVVSQIACGSRHTAVITSTQAAGTIGGENSSATERMRLSYGLLDGFWRIVHLGRRYDVTVMMQLLLYS
jgi:hypothetical protein